jgi:hypothetical protein
MMRQSVIPGHFNNGLFTRLNLYGANFPRRVVIGAILIIALIAFEIFNFDTTRYALRNLLGNVAFLGLGWAAILALAFCAIDFAGLVRMFTPDKAGEEPREVWFLMGAWLLGATMNALMTWWAVSLTLLQHDFGNEVLSRGQLLQIVPVFVAVLVWLTRILFIGALTVAGEHLIEFGISDRPRPVSRQHAVRNSLAPGQRQQRPLLGERQPALASHLLPQVSDEVPSFLHDRRAAHAATRPDLRLVVEDEEDDETVVGRPSTGPAPTSVHRNGKPNGHQNGRVRQRPPVPGAGSKNISARPRGRN